MQKYLIDNLNVNGNNAGPKARADIRYFLHQMGFSDLIGNDQGCWFQKQDTLWRKLFSKIRQLTSQDVVVFQYPIYSKILMRKIIYEIKNQRARCYLIIHDLESLRIFKNRPRFQKYEVSLINNVDGVIVHNDRMKEKLRQLGVRVPMAVLQLFDYQSNGIIPNHQNSNLIAFAGNLMKAGFLSKWQFNLKLNVYGKSCRNLKNVHYCGSVNAEELPGKLTESYGLVWDGNQLNCCNGMYGNYIRYNNPHKFSLYLCAGMPVITWKKAAIADFIIQNQVGFVVNSLTEINPIISKISDEQYQKMVVNAQKIAQKVRRGAYIKRALKKLIEY